MCDVATIDRKAVARACREHGVSYLALFGSAATGRFVPGRSDMDFLVEFRDDVPNHFDSYFGLKNALETIVDAPVDLVVNTAITNPFFARTARAQAIQLYAA